MNNIKQISEIKKILKSKNYNDEAINEFVNFLQPFHEFYDFMLKEYNMTFKQVEKETSKFSKEIFNDYLEYMNKAESKLEYMIEINGDIMKKYAIKYNYKEPEKIKKAMKKYMEILLINEIKK